MTVTADDVTLETAKTGTTPWLIIPTSMIHTEQNESGKFEF